MMPEPLLTADAFIDGIIKSLVSTLWFWTKEYWIYITIFVVLVIIGVIVQINMMKSGGHRNRLPPAFNRLVGSLTYWFIFWIQVVIAYWIFGNQVIDDLWFLIFGGVAFPVTKLFLVKIGFWYY